MKTIKKRKYNPNKPRQPRGKLGINVGLLQQLLWKGKQYPAVLERYRYSPELMKIFKILVNQPSFFHEGIKYDFSPDDKLALVFGEGHRHIYTYKATEDFYMDLGILWDTDESLSEPLIDKARDVRVNDILLLRVDNRNNSDTVDLQVLSASILQDNSEDYKVFTLNKSDFVRIRSKLKFVKEGQNENLYGSQEDFINN
jgi:hypothetical protein